MLIVKVCNCVIITLVKNKYWGLMTLIHAETNRECLTASQARKRSGLSNVYLAQLLRKGILEGFKIDRDWFIYSDSLERFLEMPRKPGPKGSRKALPRESVEAMSTQSSKDTS